MRNLLLPLCLMILGPLGAAQVASAGPSAAEQSVIQLSRRLGTPARAEAVFDVYQSLDRHNVEATIRFAAALRHSGGPEAARGLMRLFRNPHASVRVAALKSVGKLGLRIPAVLDRVRFASMDTETSVVIATCEALGSVGDGRDVPTLLLLARSEDKETRVAAYRSLRALTGVRIPHVYARWSWWWRTRSERARREIPAALEALETAPDAESAAEHEAVVRREAWILLPAVREQLAAWLSGTALDRRLFACRLAAELQLADLLEAIRPLARHGFRKDIKEAAAEAVRVLSQVKETIPGPSPVERSDR